MLTFTPQYAGLSGQPISFSVVNEMLPTNAPAPYNLAMYIDNPTIVLKAAQTGTAGEASFTYNWLAACNGGGPPPVNTAPTVVNPIPNQLATVGQAFAYTIPASTFTDAQTPGSLGLSASGLPAGLSLAGSLISGTPGASGVSAVTITATDPGSLSVSTTFSLTVNPAGVVVPPAGPFSITSVTTVSCTVISTGKRMLTFTPQYAGLSGQPISFSVVNEVLPTNASGPYALAIYTDNPTIVLKAVQTGTAGEASFTYNWLAACGGARLGAAVEPTAVLRIKLLGNPVHNAVEIDVTGAGGTLLQLSLIDMMGRIVGESRIEQAGTTERHRFDVSTLPAGTLLLRASTPNQSETVRVLNVN